MAHGAAPWRRAPGSAAPRRLRLRAAAASVFPRLLFAAEHMLASLPADWLVLLIVERAARAAVAASPLAPALCAGKLQLWELAADSFDLRRVCPRGAPAGGADAWAEVAVLAAEGALAPLPGFLHASQWAAGRPFANEVQVAPVTLAAIPTERYLVFQPDGVLCGPTSAADPGTPPIASGRSRGSGTTRNI